MAKSRIKGITVVIGGDTTGLDKALKGVNKEIKDTQAELKDVERALKLDPGNTVLLAQKQRLLTEELEKSKQKLDALKNAEKQVQEQFKKGEASRQQVEALQREVIETKKTTESLEEQAKKANVAFQKISQTAKDVAEGAEEIAGSIDKFKGAATVASGAVVAGGALGVKAITDMDSAIKDFSAKTGLSAKSIEYWKQSMEDVYKAGYGEGFEDIADSMALIKNQIGALDTSSLTELTENAFVLRDVFGYDVSESVRSAKALMDNFGLSGNEAFELIAYGAQNGLDYSGELLDSINEYSVQFDKFGFTAEEMFAIFAAGAENGAFNLDKVGDAMKEFSIRAIDGSDTTVAGFKAIGLSADDMASKIAAGGDGAKQAFEQTITALSEMEDPVKRNAAGVQLFGTMWEDLGEEAVLALGGANDYLQETEGTLNSIKETKYDTLTQQFETLGRAVQTQVLAPLAEQLMPALKQIVEFLEGLVQKFSEMTPEGKNFFLVISGIIAILPFFLSFLAGIMKSIGTIATQSSKLAEFITTTAVPGIKTAFGGFQTFVTTKFIPAITTGLSALVNFITGTVLPMISNAFGFLVNTVLPAIGNAFSSVISFIIANPITLIIAAIVGLVALIATKGDEIQALLQKLDDFLQNIFVKDWTQVFGPVLGNILNGFFKIVEDVWNSVKRIFDGIIDFIRGVFTGDWERAWKGVSNIFGGIFDGLIAIAKAPINAIIGILNAAIGGINSLISGLNKIRIDVPSWVPGLGGKSFGMSIPNIPNIPFLAKGGTLYEGSAIVGEAGPELLTMMGNKAVVQPLTNQSATTNLGGVNIVIHSSPGQNAQELADIVMEKMQHMTQRKGATFGA